MIIAEILVRSGLIILNAITGDEAMSFSHEDGKICSLHIGDTGNQNRGFRSSDTLVYATIGCNDGKVFSWELAI